jgi:hypothetical protein
MICDSFSTSSWRFDVICSWHLRLEEFSIEIIVKLIDANLFDFAISTLLIDSFDSDVEIVIIVRECNMMSWEMW